MVVLFLFIMAVVSMPMIVIVMMMVVAVFSTVCLIDQLYFQFLDKFVLLLLGHAGRSSLILIFLFFPSTSSTISFTAH